MRSKSIKQERPVWPRLKKGELMQTKTKYEEMILKEFREIPDESRPQILKILRSLKKSIAATRKNQRGERQESGLCGIWKDDRPAEEIIKDIHVHRTGYGGRTVEL